MTNDADRPQFSVYIVWPESTHPICRFERIDVAMSQARTIIHMIKATPQMRQPDQVIVTDGGDCTVVEWQPKLGLVWPDDEPTRRYFDDQGSGD